MSLNGYNPWWSGTPCILDLFYEDSVLSFFPFRQIPGGVYICLQGVPRNMTIARRLESGLWYLNLFVTFSLLSTLTCMILETIIT